MELRNYVLPLLRWWWLILAASIIAAATSFYFTRDLPRSFQSRTTLIIGQSISSTNPSPGQFALEQQLALIYADMARREPIRRAAMDSLGLTEMPVYVARAVPETQLIEITVTDTNPARAQAVAAELANQLILRAPTQIVNDSQERQDFVNQQLVVLQNDIQDTQAEIDELNVQLGSMNSAQQIADTQRLITGLRLKLTTLQATYSSLLAGTQRGALNTLSIIEPPEIPTRPMGSNRPITIILAGALGAVLAGLGVYGIEALDQTVRSGQEAASTLNWPLLAEIPKIKSGVNPLTYVTAQPLSHVADAFRTLRTNLEVIDKGQRATTILVTSAGVGDGKSTVAANLAQTFARTNQRVILVDADVHQSSFDIEHAYGLSDLLVGWADPNDYLVNWQLPQLFFLGKGNQAPGTNDLFGSTDVVRVLSDLKSVADVIVIDSPPLGLSDALSLATKADGVVFVIRPDRTRRLDLARLRIQLAAVKVPVLGMVVNGTASLMSHYSHYYQELPDVGGPASRL